MKNKKKKKPYDKEMIRESVSSKIRYSFYIGMFIMTILSIVLLKPMWLIVIIALLILFVIRLNMGK